MINHFYKWWELFRGNKKLFFLFIVLLLLSPLWNVYQTNLQNFINQIIIEKKDIDPFDQQNFGILIAPFYGTSKKEIEDGIRIQHAIATTLNARINQENIENASAKSLPFNKQYRIKSPKEARLIGKKYNAKIVLWGDIALNRIIFSITIVPDNLKSEPELNQITVKKNITILSQDLIFKSLDQPFSNIKLPIFTEDIISIAESVIGIKYFKQKKYKRAVFFLKKALRKKHNDDSFIYYSGIYCTLLFSYVLLHDKDNLVNECNRIMDLELNDEWPYQICGSIYDGLNLPDQAMLANQRAFSISHDTTSYANLAMNYIKFKKDYDKAIDLYTEAINELRNPWFYLRRGLTYMDYIHNYKKALDDFNKLIKIYRSYRSYQWKSKDGSIMGFAKVGDYDLDQILYYRAIAYGNLKQYDLAIDDLTYIINDLSSKNTENKYVEFTKSVLADSYRLRGLAYYDLSNFQKSYEDLSQSTKLNPEDSSAWFWKAKAQLHLKQFDSAFDSIDKALKYKNKKPNKQAESNDLKMLERVLKEYLPFTEQ